MSQTPVSPDEPAEATDVDALGDDLLDDVMGGGPNSVVSIPTTGTGGTSSGSQITGSAF